MIMDTANENHDELGDKARTHIDPDPIEELATIDDHRQDNDPDRPHLAQQPGPQPGFGPDEFSAPMIKGDPELGIDPRETPESWATGPKAP